MLAIHETKRRPTIGLALSGGGAKAAAHLGVLRVLGLVGLKTDWVAGTSGGALAGLFHCDGHSPESSFAVMRDRLMGRPWWRHLPGGRYWQLARLFRRGILRQVIAEHVSARTFEELKTPLYTTATDLITGESVVHHTGDVAAAVMASMSLPGIASPVPIDNRWFVDGGVLNNIPVNALLRQHADIIIAVDLGACNAPKPEWSCWRPRGNSVDVLRRAWEIQNRELTRRNLSAADLVIRPDVAEFGMADLDDMDLLMRRGEEAAIRAIPLLENILRSWDRPSDRPSLKPSSGESTLLRHRRDVVSRRLAH